MVVELTAPDIRSFVGENPLILEIGANDGADTLLFLEAMPRATIYCFEPDPRAISRFKERVWDARVSLIEAAVSDRDGQAIFRGSSGRAPARSRRPDAPACVYLDEWDLSGSLLEPTGHLSYSPWVTFPENRRYEVCTITLDAWRKAKIPNQAIDFIWADVQGAESLVILGATDTLADTTYFYTEFYNKEMYNGQPNLNGIRKMLPGFKLLGTYGDNALFKNLKA